MSRQKSQLYCYIQTKLLLCFWNSNWTTSNHSFIKSLITALYDCHIHICHLMKCIPTFWQKSSLCNNRLHSLSAMKHSNKKCYFVPFPSRYFYENNNGFTPLHFWWHSSYVPGFESRESDFDPCWSDPDAGVTDDRGGIVNPGGTDPNPGMTGLSWEAAGAGLGDAAANTLPIFWCWKRPNECYLRACKTESFWDAD